MPALNDTPLMLGGALAITDGVEDRLQIPPLLPGDSVDELRLYAGCSDGDADASAFRLSLALYANDSRPPTVAAAKNGVVVMPALADIRPEAQLTNLAAGIGQFGALWRLNVPLLYFPSQRGRWLTLVYTFSGSGTNVFTGFAFAKIFRPRV